MSILNPKPLILVVNYALAPYGLAVFRSDLSLVTLQISEVGKRPAEYVIEHIETILKDAGADISDIGHIVMVSGPGNYTGLRMSATTVNMLAQLRGISLTALPTMHWVVRHLVGFDGTYLVVVPGTRGHINTQLMGIDREAVTHLSEIVSMSVTEFSHFVGQFKARLNVAGVLPAEFESVCHDLPMAHYIKVQLDLRYAIDSALITNSEKRIRPIYFHQAVRPVEAKGARL